MATQYQYRPLTQRLETRVLKLLPGHSKQPLKGHLDHYIVGDDSPYSALSYEWGEPDLVETIDLGHGEHVAITASLQHALRDLRDEKDVVILWADGICIDQQDKPEREAQVMIMGDIYSYASRVVTYIGPSSADSDLAITFGKELTRNFYSAPEFELEGDARFPPPSDPRVVALKDLIRRTWSGRSWCAHEFLLNQHLVMRCGRASLPWTMLPFIIDLAFADRIPRTYVPNASEDTTDLRECLLQLYDLRMTEVGRSNAMSTLYASRSLLYYLNRFHPFRATDPRDKIYALKSLLMGSGKLDFVQVEYSVQAEHLYWRIAAHIVGVEKDLRILHANHSSKNLNLPSWVPDWSAWQVGSVGLDADDNYMACGATEADCRAADERNLIVRGSLVDSISDLSDDDIGPFNIYAGCPGQREWTMRQIVFASNAAKCGDEAVAREKLWQTLSGEIHSPGSKEAEDYRDAFGAYEHFDPLSSDGENRAKADEFTSEVRRRSRYRRLAGTKHSYLAAVPQNSQIGDVICMLNGMRLLYVLRPHGDHFQYIGHCYVNGLMEGGVLSLPWYEEREITMI